MIFSDHGKHNRELKKFFGVKKKEDSFKDANFKTYPNALSELECKLLHAFKDYKNFKLYPYQKEILAMVDNVKKNEILKIAMAGGHGVGKTALVSWIILLFVAFKENAKVVCTSGRMTQLQNVLWAEARQWSIRGNFPNLKWMSQKIVGISTAEARSWDEHSPDKFAGTHADEVMFIFDEAISIPESIWNTTVGALTNCKGYWIVNSNPTTRDSYFYRCFEGGKTGWHHYNISCFDVNDGVGFEAMANEIIRLHGQDSDEYRIRVLGQFPLYSSSQFFPEALIQKVFDAPRFMDNRYVNPYDPFEPQEFYIAADVASGHGNDYSTIVIRDQIRLIEIIRIKEDIQMFQIYIEQILKKYNTTKIAIDEVGIGNGVYYSLRGKGYDVTPVQGTSKFVDRWTHYDYRTELYGRLKNWLMDARGGGIEYQDELIKELRSIKVFYVGSALKLQEKKAMEFSPDIVDACAYTFAIPKTENKRSIISVKI